MYENEMVIKGINYFHHLNNFQWIKQEVPFMSRSIDVLLLDNNDKLISIEFKMSNWKHAIEQALDHRIGADLSYICLPKKNITPLLKEGLINSGIGLMMYDNDKDIVTEEIHPSPKITVVALRNLLLKMATNIPSTY